MLVVGCGGHQVAGSSPARQHHTFYMTKEQIDIQRRINLALTLQAETIAHRPVKPLSWRERLLLTVHRWFRAQ